MAAYYQTFDDYVKTALQQDNKLTGILNKLEATTNVKKNYIVEGLLGLFGVYMIIGHFAGLVSNLVGFLYPAYCSLNALETPHADDDRKWLTYWVVFAFFSVIEFFSDKIFFWFPFYFLAKVIFLIYCFAPIENNGAMRLYNNVIRPYYLKKRGVIEGKLNNLDLVTSGDRKNAKEK